MIADYSTALVDGPWRHEFVAANGARFHVALAGPDPTERVGGEPAPLVVLLHDFPQLWWAWRHQIVALADAGYRVAAMDLRGTGASDKPPLGYDVPTRTRDVAGVVRSLGADRATVVGNGFGGTVAWAMAAMQPAVTAAVAAFAAPHPAHLHTSRNAPYTRAFHRRLASAQAPFAPERGLVDGRLVDSWLQGGAHVPFDDDVLETYRTAARIPFAAHCSVEALRWWIRSVPRMDGRRFTTAVRRRLDQPALLALGADDPYLRTDASTLDAAAFASHLRVEVVDDAGHYLPEEAPGAVSELLLDWLKGARRP
ncbi:alpha/beta fold hydrolase [Luteimicrobium subarcticum]|uniref:Pimeloyl-ACP methyl ester carboxylesterase n=1 Tax=Luteimicrobium subarcticum TaxID=620910 RepID=A0A2M8WW02_9MICO|nr:alpha/beta hydrolase [Luteimicrobium subarcticum]PJI95099.1 pimeloyl-ACP methyl ester carboxylesterase [Luteimicrobium subarcticum]